ncbi:MAG: hypothetical protein V1909_03790 [Candidatus Micrarchaeota archaeon]
MNKGIAYAASAAALILVGMLFFASKIKLIAQVAFAAGLFSMFLLATPLVLVVISLCGIVLAGTAVVFSIFYLNYIFQKKIIDSASVDEESEVSEWE